MYAITYEDEGVIEFISTLKSSERKYICDNFNIIEEKTVPNIKILLWMFKNKIMSFYEKRFLKMDISECKNSDLDGYYSYEPSDNKSLSSILKKIETSNKNILDVGSGKGSAILTMNKFDFNEIYGVEYNFELYKISKRNMDAVNKMINLIYLFCCDIVEYMEKHDNNIDYYYLFNPFNSNIFSKFLEIAMRHQDNNKKEIGIIYKNPICESILINNGFKIIQEEIDFLGTRTVLYRKDYNE